ncbi:E3 ubiquitin-protein ligase RING1-like [Selaginella moellendorffii]|uniref:E3 ubiquitin-protein ligase RING1-like n=1 Tax=Selaginella moellendorffii TaxID=88036 RepID=UPI000D1D114A|nr:E3 ubiquitin-protein ligase RING1-like [Selaginella moellendorffii]|eukprot:XP_024521808.1 E3 ubiquitin-protein ligase RING1-like [Selaginella moellendorffii]
MSAYAESYQPAVTHFCHGCNLSVRAVTTDDVICPFCQGGFVEEISSDEEIPVAASTNSAPGSAAPPPPPPPPPPPGPGSTAPEYPPRVIPQRHMFIQTLTALMQGGGVGNVEFVVDHVGNQGFVADNGANPGSRRTFGNFGDYFFGADYDHLLQQLAENDLNRYGTPPASKTAVEGMPTMKITDEHLAQDSAPCAVCKDEFELGTEVREMPCKHLYHPDCILPWLKQHNSCPVCRFELATDDADYNQARMPGTAGSGGGGGRRGREFLRGHPYRVPVPPWLLGSEASGSGGGEEYDSLRDVD